MFSKAFLPKAPDNSSVAATPYAYIFKYESVSDVEFLAALLQKNIKVRAATKAFTSNGQRFEPAHLLSQEETMKELATLTISLKH